MGACDVKQGRMYVLDLTKSDHKYRMWIVKSTILVKALPQKWMVVGDSWARKIASGVRKGDSV
jgi:hypothetical protein